MARLTILTAAAGLMLCATVSNADECKFKTNERDPLTSERDVLTKWKAFRPTGNQSVSYGWMAGRVKDGTTLLALRIGIVGKYVKKPLIIPEGAKLLVLMADGSIVELSAYEETWVRSRDTVILYELNDELLTALTAHGATDIRVSTNQSDYDFSFGKKPTDRMRFVLECVQS